MSRIYRVTAENGPVARPVSSLGEARRLGDKLGDGTTISDRWGNYLEVRRGGRWLEVVYRNGVPDPAVR